VRARTTLLLHAAAFIVCLALGVGFAVSYTGLRTSDLQPLLRLDARLKCMLVAMAVVFFAADQLRYLAFAWALGTRPSARASLDAAIACNFFAMLTPGGTMGAPGAIYMLCRHGMPVGIASVIAFLKSLVSTLFLLLSALAMFALGLGPTLDGPVIGLLTGAVVLLGTLLTPLVVAAALPGWTQKGVGVLDRWVGERPLARRVMEQILSVLAHLQKLRASSIPMLLSVNLLYFVNLIGILVLIATGLGAEPIPVTSGISTLYLAFVYVAPTPGAAGLAEGTGASFFARVLPPTMGLAAVLAFRMLTAWLQIAVGAVHLAWVGGLEGVFAGRKSLE